MLNVINKQPEMQTERCNDILYRSQIVHRLHRLKNGADNANEIGVEKNAFLLHSTPISA